MKKVAESFSNGALRRKTPQSKLSKSFSTGWAELVPLVLKNMLPGLKSLDEILFSFCLTPPPTSHHDTIATDINLMNWWICHGAIYRWRSRGSEEIGIKINKKEGSLISLATRLSPEKSAFSTLPSRCSLLFLATRIRESENLPCRTCLSQILTLSLDIDVYDAHKPKGFSVDETSSKNATVPASCVGISELGPAWSTERMRKRLAGVMECVEFHSIAIQLMRLKSSPTYSRSIFTPRSAFTVRSQSSQRLFEVSRMSFWMCKLRRQWDDSACISRLIFCGLVKGIFPIPISRWRCSWRGEKKN